MTDGEVRALRQFVSRDTARPQLCTMWHYTTPEGELTFASDGHTMAMRVAMRSRVPWYEMPWEQLEAKPLQKMPTDEQCKAPNWTMYRETFARPRAKGPLAFSFAPAYLGRLAAVESVVAKLEQQSLRIAPGMTKERARALRSQCSFASELRFGSDNDLEPLIWSVVGRLSEIQWHGLIMPRRM